MKQIHYNEKVFKQIDGEDCIAEDYNYMPRSNFGMRKWEIKTRCPDGHYKIIVLSDSGFSASGEVIEIKDYKTRDKRNAEICRLYHEHGLSQVFLAKVFNMCQPSISVIVNRK